MLWDAADGQCLCCDVSAACHEALTQETGPDRSTDGGGIGYDQGAPSSAEHGTEPMQSAIEQAFSAAEPTVPDIENGISMTSRTSSPTGSEPAKKLIHFSTRLPEGLDVELKVYCALNKMKVQNFIAEAIQDRLKR